jgi:hypothetical protein
MLTNLGPAYAASFATAMDAVAPGWKGIMHQLEGGIQTMLQGKLPADVTSMIEKTMAEKNLSGGRYGQVADSATAKTLGLTSLGMVQAGQAEANQYLQIAKGLSPQVTDLQGLIGGAMTFESQAKQLALQERQLTETMKQAAEDTALKKLQLQLTSQAQQAELSERQYEFGASLNWEKQVSAWNRDYERWSTGERQRLAQQGIASEERIAGQQANTFSNTLTKYMDQLRTTMTPVPSLAGNPTPVSTYTPTPTSYYPNYVEESSRNPEPLTTYPTQYGSYGFY